MVRSTVRCICGVVAVLVALSGSILGAAEQPVRFVIGLERSVDFEVLTLTNPDRVVVDLPDVRMRLPSPSSNTATGLVKSFRGGLATSGRARVIIDLAAPVLVKRAEIGKAGEGYHLALDLVADEPSAKGRKYVRGVSTPQPSSVNREGPKFTTAMEIRAFIEFKLDLCQSKSTPGYAAERRAREADNPLPPKAIEILRDLDERECEATKVQSEMQGKMTDEELVRAWKPLWQLP